MTPTTAKCNESIDEVRGQEDFSEKRLPTKDISSLDQGIEEIDSKKLIRIRAEGFRKLHVESGANVYINEKIRKSGKYTTSTVKEGVSLIEYPDLQMNDNLSEKISYIAENLDERDIGNFSSQLGDIIVSISQRKIREIPERFIDKWNRMAEVGLGGTELIDPSEASKVEQLLGIKRESIPGYITNIDKSYINFIFIDETSYQQTVKIPRNKVNIKKLKKHANVTFNILRQENGIKYWFEEIPEIEIRREELQEALKEIQDLIGFED